MKKKGIAITLGVLLILGGIAYLLYQKYTNDQMEARVLRDVIYEGIFIDGVDVGDMTRQEATATLEAHVKERFKYRILKVLAGQVVSYELPYEYFEYDTDYVDQVEQAYRIGKSGTIKERYAHLQKLKENPVAIMLSSWFKEESVAAFVSDISPDYYVEPKDATIEKGDPGFVIHDEVIGVSLNQEQSTKAILEALNLGAQEVSLVFDETQPSITRAFYETMKDVIGEYATTFSSGQTNRNENLRVACSMINGTILMPGETFSTNDAIGPVDSEHGYQMASVISGGKITQGIGGGVCQVATTLYNAVLYAELTVTQRQNHSLTVGYVEKGRDATLAGDYIDFKFVNNRETPIYIESYIEGSQVHMRIFGKETRDEGRRIEFESVIISTVEPPSATVIVDATLAPGEEIIEKNGTIGYTVKLYKLIYIQDELIDKIEVNSSNYQPSAAIIRVGP